MPLTIRLGKHDVALGGAIDIALCFLQLRGAFHERTTRAVCGRIGTAPYAPIKS